MMNKIKVTQQQRDNAVEALTVMWPSVPPENVSPRLEMYRDSLKMDCGSHACFGGWCAVYPTFVGQGLHFGRYGLPAIGDELGGEPCADALFGDDLLFFERGVYPSDWGFRGSDHALVTHRLNWLIENSEVVS